MAEAGETDIDIYMDLDGDLTGGIDETSDSNRRASEGSDDFQQGSIKAPCDQEKALSQSSSTGSLKSSPSDEAINHEAGQEQIIRTRSGNNLNYNGLVHPQDWNNNSEGGAKKYGAFIGNLTWWTTDIMIKDLLSEHGVFDLLDLKIFEHKSNGQSKGFCSIYIGSENSMKIIFDKIPRTEFQGRHPLVLNNSKENLYQLEAMAKPRPSDLNTFDDSMGSWQRYEFGNGVRSSSNRGVAIDSYQYNGIGNGNGGYRSFHGLRGGPRSNPRHMHPYHHPPHHGGYYSHAPRTPYGGSSWRGVGPRGPYLSRGPYPGGMGVNHHQNLPPYAYINPTPLFPSPYPRSYDLGPESGHFKDLCSENNSSRYDYFDGIHEDRRKAPLVSPLKEEELSEKEKDELMERNQKVSSAAINRAVGDAASGDFESARDTLETAISIIGKSPVSREYLTTVLLTSLKLTLDGMNNRIQDGFSKHSERSSKKNRDSRERSRSRERTRSRSYTKRGYREESSSRSSRSERERQ